MKFTVILALTLFTLSAFAQKTTVTTKTVTNKPVVHDKEHSHVDGDKADHAHDDAHHGDHDHKAHHPDHVEVKKTTIEVKKK